VARKLTAVGIVRSEHLKQAIDSCEWLSPKLPFFYGASRISAYLANEVYEGCSRQALDVVSRTVGRAGSGITLSPFGSCLPDFNLRMSRGFLAIRASRSRRRLCEVDFQPQGPVGATRGSVGREREAQRFLESIPWCTFVCRRRALIGLHQLPRCRPSAGLPLDVEIAGTRHGNPVVPTEVSRFLFILSQ
jgi:hypothetical protein